MTCKISLMILVQFIKATSLCQNCIKKRATIVLSIIVINCAKLKLLLVEIFNTLHISLINVTYSILVCENSLDQIPALKKKKNCDL